MFVFIVLLVYLVLKSCQHLMSHGGRKIEYCKVQIGKDHEKAQSEKDSHSKNGDGKNLN